MLFLSFLLHQLNPHIVFISSEKLLNTCPPRLDFIDDQKTLTADRTWIGTGEKSLDKFENININDGIVVFISDYGPHCRCPEKHPNATIICVSFSLVGLYNIINNAICQIRMWKDEYFTAADQSLYATLELTANLSSSSVVLLNPNYKIVLSSGLENSAFLTGQLAHSGTLPKQIVDNLFAEDVFDNLPVEYSIPNNQRSLYGLRIYHEKNLISVLVLEADSERTDIDFLGLCACARQAFYHHIISTSSLRLGTYTKKFKEFWQEVMTQKLIQPFEVLQELKQLPFPAETFVRVLVVAFQHKNTEQTPYNYVLAQLREIFPDCNMTVYENEVIILKTHCERCFNLDLNTERITEILELSNGFIGISNGTRNYGTLRSLYLLAKNTIPLACELRKNRGERIFFYEDFWTYTIIDMCAHRFFELHHHDDIVYLIHPAVILITRYDKKHNTNLRDTLLYYLLNDRNLVKTAAVTFAHRNTVINKVHKINDLICLDLEDGVLRQRLIFSCQVIDYYENYLKKELQI